MFVVLLCGDGIAGQLPDGRTMSECIPIVPIPGRCGRRDDVNGADVIAAATSCNNNNDSSTPADVIESLSITIDEEAAEENKDGVAGKSPDVSDDRQAAQPIPNGVLPPSGDPDESKTLLVASEEPGGTRSRDGSVSETRISRNSASSDPESEVLDSLGSLSDIPNTPGRADRQAAIVTLSRRMLATNTNLDRRRKSSIFLTLGRDFESVYTNHRYTAKERELLASHDSFDYLPSYTAVYREWLRRQPSRLDWDRWIMMGLIGTTIGFIGFLMHQSVHLIAEVKWEKTNHFIHENIMKAWGWLLGYSVLFATLSSASVAFFCLPAGGSGIPEVIGFLNGTIIRHVFTLRAFLVKFFSCMFAVGAGLPVGPEGPMIHIGSVIGSGLSQFRSRALKISLPWFTRFRNSEDRRNFTTAGAAAGVASAFTAPVGGLLFAMEEVSSFWSMKLGWMIFFACMLATFTTDLLNASFHAFQFSGVFGLFHTDKFIIFKLGNAIPVNAIMFLPAMILGFIGGILGAAFTIINLKINRTRRRMVAKLRKPILQKIVRFIEPIVIMIVWGTIVIYLPAAFPCKPIVCPQAGDTVPVADSSRGQHISFSEHRRADVSAKLAHVTDNMSAQASYGIYAHDNHITASDLDTAADGQHGESGEGRDHHGDGGHDGDSSSQVHCPKNSTKPYAIDDGVKQYWCSKPVIVNGTIIEGSYNEAASLLNLDGQSALRLLFSRRTHLQFGYESLLTVLTLYYFMAVWAAGSAVASGIVVPMLFIGGLYGRALGRLLVDLHGGVPESDFWKWIDPGAMALIGAASFFGGVSRLTISLTVIMIEVTNDVGFLLPIMVAIMIAKWVGDYITHPLYHSLLEMKCIPFLDTEPVVYDNQQNLLNLELFKARDVMHSPVITLTARESAAHLAHLLLETSHGGFPIIQWNEDIKQEVVHGLITRTELCVILSNKKIAEQKQSGVTITPQLEYEELAKERLPDNSNIIELLERYVEETQFKEVYVNLEPFVNRSALHVQEDFSLHRTYIVFRTLGLRHLTVVDNANRVVGIISRKDLMGYNLEEKLEQRKRRGYSLEGGIQKLLPSEQSQGDVRIW